jgi:hypothetical protein
VLNATDETAVVPVCEVDYRKHHAAVGKGNLVAGVEGSDHSRVSHPPVCREWTSDADRSERHVYVPHVWGLIGADFDRGHCSLSGGSSACGPAPVPSCCTGTFGKLESHSLGQACAAG